METFQPGVAATRPVTKIEVSISCQNLLNKDLLSKSDPFVAVIQVLTGGQKNELDRTETIQDNLNPVFEKKIMVDYFFEERQLLEFQVYDSDSSSRRLSDHDHLGSVTLALGEIVSAPNCSVQRPISIGGTPRGSIHVTAEEISQDHDAVEFQIKGKDLDRKDWFGKSDPYVNIYRANEGNTWTLVKKTEFIKNTLNPSWRPFSIPVDLLCRGDYDRVLKFEVNDWNSDGSVDFIGQCTASLRHLTGVESSRAVQSTFDLVNAERQKKKGSKYKNSGVLTFVKVHVLKKFGFLEYIRGGTDLNFTVAVDFTASNGNPSDPRSLHYRDIHAPNQYQQAIRAVGEIIQDYDADKLFPALGFGARLPPDGRVSHEFFLNLHPSNPHCQYIDGIMAAYQQSLDVVQLYGPTNFAPVINHVAKIATLDVTGANYYVLLIVTDGVITDMPHTVDAIIAASHFPMSIIIVGVGDADFDAMDALDADDQLLSNGRDRAVRDIVQFVPFRDFNKGRDFAGNQARLAKAVLEELPNQLTLFMEQRGIKPGPGRRAPANPTFGGSDGAPPPPSYQAASGSAPYPSPGGPSGSAPYQPPGAPSGGAPYPPSGAPSGSAPYPPAGASSGSAPYPPPASNPFYPSAP